jgi:DNA-binding NtrC family response regulator
MDTLLIVEDDETIRATLTRVLMRHGLDVAEADSLQRARELLSQQSFGLVLLDLQLPDGNGLELMPQLRESDDQTLIVVMTAYPEVRTAVNALKAGAWDYINKPFDLEDLLELLGRAKEIRHLRHEVAWRRAQTDTCSPAGWVGESPAFAQLVQITHRIAEAGQVPVLIRGESGTGKELVAQAIHCRSNRAQGPWVALNCSALAPGLLESELFGHEKGAFTDARQAKRGLMELADGGTLFLDEIGDLALDLQPKLLRALETHSFRRVGGSREIHVDVRFVAATHRNLPDMVKSGSFREDLFYRLNVGAIDVPPLRERQADILPLARHFLRDISKNLATVEPQLTAEAATLLLTYAWPGNVRELRNVLERAAILCSSGIIAPDHLPREMQTTQTTTRPMPADDSTTPATLAEVEDAHIRHVLALADGNKTRAAQWLGISRLTLRNKLGE